MGFGAHVCRTAPPGRGAVVSGRLTAAAAMVALTLVRPASSAAQTDDRLLGTDPFLATETLFADDFESGLDGWRFPYGSGHELVATGGPQGTALRMAVEALPVYALMEGSETWGDVRVEGSVLFPTDDHAYLGFIYHYRDDGRRIDFGSLYIKGNDGYVQANEHHDTNVGRTFYPELRTYLDGPTAVEPGIWQRFALEVVGDDAHLYVGDMTRPVMTLLGSPRREGGIGFKPRNPGAPVLIDDITAASIRRLSWGGPPVPEVAYRRSDYLTDWSVLGPLASFVDAIELGDSGEDLRVHDDGRFLSWEPLPADHRGAVMTGRVVEFRDDRRVGYFRTRFRVSDDGSFAVHMSSADDVAVWVDGAFEGFARGRGAAWFDASVNEDRPTFRISEALAAGEHELVIRIVGGLYATGGFYAWLGDPE